MSLDDQALYKGMMGLKGGRRGDFEMAYSILCN